VKVRPIAGGTDPNKPMTVENGRTRLKQA